MARYSTQCEARAKVSTEQTRNKTSFVVHTVILIVRSPLIGGLYRPFLLVQYAVTVQVQCVGFDSKMSISKIDNQEILTDKRKTTKFQ